MLVNLVMLLLQLYKFLFFEGLQKIQLNGIP